MVSRRRDVYVLRDDRCTRDTRRGRADQDVADTMPLECSNEVLACFRCNSSKGNRTLADWLESDRCPVPRWRSFAFLFEVAPVQQASRLDIRQGARVGHHGTRVRNRLHRRAETKAASAR